jgi:peptidoglycan/xylan/chitin deacetylase (PgdA/CDA1 family)
VRNLPILLYHRVDAGPAEDDHFRLRISPQSFEQQMRYLKRHGYRSLSLEEFVLHVKTGTQFLPKTLVITFDDGYESTFTTAFPTLREYGFVATTFIITDFVGQKRIWPGQRPSSFLSWDQIREMSRAGFSFGSHTCTHPSLIKLPPEQVWSEIRKSKVCLEDQLGVPIVTFAYPGGHQNEFLQRIVAQAHYQAACGVDVGPSGLFNLWRIQIHTDDSLALFGLKVSGWFEKLKQLRQRSSIMWDATSLVYRTLSKLPGAGN